MYQFSLDWYKQLFEKSIEKSRENLLQDRIYNIMKEHMLAVYQNSCRSLFEKHKLLLSTQIVVKIKMGKGEVNPDEWNFFLKGGQVLDRSQQPPKPPYDWITPQAWDNITELEKQLPETFSNIANAITLAPKEWQRWFMQSKPPPENAPLPGEWESKCEDRLKKMIVLRCLRPDRVLFAIRNFIEANVDQMHKKDFIESRPTSLREIYESFSHPKLPIIFVLSPGVDPTEQLKQVADSLQCDVTSISLGKGQSDKAKRMLQEGAAKGNWVFLANCHLSISLLPELESIIDVVFQQPLNKNFRLFLSSNPHPHFPISLLQRSLKITSEPPSGIKSNMMRLYNNMGEFQAVEKKKNFRKALYGLCFFHAILIERKKFKTLGWNVVYAFNDSDFGVCEDLLAIYFGKLKDDRPSPEFSANQEVPWEAVQYLIAEANYGGRVTDDRDRLLLKTYAEEIFNDNLIKSDKWKPPGTEELNYTYPLEEQEQKGGLDLDIYKPEDFYYEISNKMDAIDVPAAFGQHVNAQITSQIMDTTELLDSIFSLQPQQSSVQGESREDKVLKLIADLLENIPESIDVAMLKNRFRNDENPLNVVLVQEISRYNILLNTLRVTLEKVALGIKGLEVMSSELETVMTALYENKVPKQWGTTYFSLKPLAVWIRDLNERYNFFKLWATKGSPVVFWISAFTYPNGFITSLLQRFSRKANAPAIDNLTFEFNPINPQQK